MRIGLISDTHLPSLIHSLDELGPEVGNFLSTVDLVLHGGDITRPSVLDWIEQFAPVHAVRGNHDVFEDPRLDETLSINIKGHSIVMAHDLRPESRPISEIIERDFSGHKPAIIIGGDTHVERLEYRDNVILMNSGSPNLLRHKETRLGTVGLLEIEEGRILAEIIILGETPNSPNPGKSSSLEILNGEILNK